MVLRPSGEALGKYANIARVSHTFDEITIEFGVKLNAKVAGLHSKIITSPSHAKRLLQALARNLERYETKFGQIREQPPTPETKDGADVRK